MEVLRKCKMCGLEATCEEDLKLFVKAVSMRYSCKNKCKACQKLENMEYNTNTQESRVVAKAKYYENRKDLSKKSSGIYYKENRDYLKRKAKQYHKDNKENIAQYVRDNQAKYAEKAAKRRAKKRNQTPELSSQQKQEIADLYELASFASSEFGIPMHVDHIIPIAKGGLHRPLNLQVITAEENLSKSDTMPSDLPEELIALHSAQ